MSWSVSRAIAFGCHIITATPDIISKVKLLGKNLKHYSLETVKMFHEDARAAGFKLVSWIDISGANIKK